MNQMHARLLEGELVMKFMMYWDKEKPRMSHYFPGGVLYPANK